MTNYRRKRVLILFQIACILTLSITYGCSQSNKSVKTTGEPESEKIPVQTNANPVESKTEFKVSIVTEDLAQPWGIDFLPDGRMIVSELEGNIRILSKDGKISEPLLGIPKVRVSGVSGLMDIKVSPDFEKNRQVFWTYPEPVGENQSINCVATGKLSKDNLSLEDVKVIYRASSAGEDGFHLGSRMLFDKIGVLFVTFGDRFAESIRGESQRLTSSLGKIIRINSDGTYAKGNPFESSTGSLKEIWSLGHRNPQGLAIHPTTGDLWSTEHGPVNGDELNRIVEGKNYGWPIISYGEADGGGPLSGETYQDEMEQPVYYWDPVVAPSGMMFYSGNLIPEWKNNLFIATLRGSHLIRLEIDEKTNAVVGEEKLLEKEGQRFRHVIQGPDEAIYAITHQGRLYKIGR